MAKVELEVIEKMMEKFVPLALGTMTKTMIELLDDNESEEVQAARYDGYVPKEAVKSYRQRNDFPEYLNAEEVSALLTISKPKVYEMFRSKDFPVNVFGKTKRVDKTDLLEFMRENRGIDLTKNKDGDDE